MPTSSQGASSSSGHTEFNIGLGRPISREQSISSQIRKLTSSFDTLLNLHEKPPVTKEKLLAVFARLDRLGLGENDGNTIDPRDPMRRADLFTTLDRIKDKLRAVSGRVEATGYTRNNEDVQTVSELVDDIRDAIIDYQTAHQQAIYDQNLRLTDRADMVVVNSCRRAHGAGHQHGNRSGCLRGTRESVLNEIERWTEDFDKRPVFWLNGLAGTGKSAIAQTIAERVFADGRLGASFFCSRGIEDRSDLQLIFPTLAFQLAQKYPCFRSQLIPLLQSNPDVTQESLQDQMQKFLVEPLRSTNISTVIVIDALDECKDEEPESAILLVLGKLIPKIPRVKFFVTSRPETHIMSGFRAPLLKDATNVFILHEVDPHTIDNDIRHFFKHELSEFTRKRRGMDGWPTDEHLDSLCRRAGGFFVYAVATLNFLKHKFKRPADRLDIIMKSPESTAHEGKAELAAHTSLDSLYTSIFQEAFRKNDAEDDAMVRSVLSTVILVVNPLSPSAVATLLDFEWDVVVSLLESIQSLLVLHDDIDHPVHPFHKSFPDFIKDSARCTDTRFYISPDYHTELVLCCLKLMDELLEKNMCSIPDYALNSEAKDLLKRAEGSGIHGALEYACRSWHKHLIAGAGRATDVVSALSFFLEQKFLFWLEALSVLSAVGIAARALNITVKWLNEIQASNEVSSLLDTTIDCFRFVTEFFDVIRQSGPHIYHSALLLAPRSSIVRNLYSQRICSPVSKVVTGAPAEWDSCTASAGTTTEVRHATWSPCGQFIAACFDDAIQIRDSNTLERVSELKPSSNRPGEIPKFLAFSPDGRLLACLYQAPDWSTQIFVWDIQTGVVINNIESQGVGELVFFGDQGTVILVGRYGTFRTYGGPNAAHTTCRDKLRSPPGFLTGAHWIHERALRFFTSFKAIGKCVVNIQEFRPTSTPPFSEVIESFQFPSYNGEFSFSPVSFHASFVTKTKVIILDIRGSRILLRVETTRTLYTPSGCFSHDGRFFACGTWEHEIHIWKNTPASYVPWSNLRPRLPFKGFSFSPTAPSILTWGLEGIQLSEPGNRPTVLPPDKLDRRHQHGNHLVAYSAEGTHIATTRRGNSAVMILDALPSTPRRSFDANVAILDIKIVDDTIFVAGGRKISSWRLKTGEPAGDHEIPAITASTPHLTLSDDCSKIAAVDVRGISLYDVRTQSVLYRHTVLDWVSDIRFSPDGRQLWFVPGFNTISSFVKLEMGDPANATTEETSDLWSWINLFSRYGWRIGGESEWVADSRGNKILWLPLSWRAKQWRDVRWDGRFLALVHRDHPDPIIIEFRA